MLAIYVPIEWFCLEALEDLGGDSVAVAALSAFAVAGRCADEPIGRECRVVDDLVEDRPAHAVALALCGKHALDDVAPSAGLRPRIPHVPPLNRHGNHEHRDEEIRV